MAEEIDPNSSIVYITMGLLCSRQNSLIPELLYVFTPQQISTFIKVFSGETIKVPTVDDFNRDLMTSLAAYHVIVEEKSWDWFRLRYQVDGNYINSIKTRLKNWVNGLSPSEKAFIEKLQGIELARAVSKESINLLDKEFNYGNQTDPP